MFPSRQRRTVTAATGRQVRAAPDAVISVVEPAMTLTGGAAPTGCGNRPRHECEPRLPNVATTNRPGRDYLALTIREINARLTAPTAHRTCPLFVCLSPHGCEPNPLPTAIWVHDQTTVWLTEWRCKAKISTRPPRGLVLNHGQLCENVSSQAVLCPTPVIAWKEVPEILLEPCRGTTNSASLPVGDSLPRHMPRRSADARYLETRLLVLPSKRRQ
jgi:hypothetical protein